MHLVLPPKLFFRRCWLLLLLLALGSSAHAANYYWVGGTGNWNDLSHWASASGGAGGAYGQVPQSVDNVYFDANSFTANNQVVNLPATVTCRSMDWRGSTRTGLRLQGGGTVEINAELHLVPSMGTQVCAFSFLSGTSSSQPVDLQNVPINGYLQFDNAAGSWTFSSNVNVNQYSSTPTLIINSGAVNFGSVTVNTYSLRSTTNASRAINLGSSTINLRSPANTWALSGTGLTFNAGTSTINVGVPAQANTIGYSFSSSQVAYHNVVVARGASTALSVANSSFDNLTINGNAYLTSAATINQALTLGADALLRASAGQIVTFAGSATLASSGSCAGLANLQSHRSGVAAVFTRPGGWTGQSVSYLAVQDVQFTGGGSLVVLNGIDRGGNASLSVSALPVNTLYWVGGTGNWHDPAHWASTSGGNALGNSCLPTLHTTVIFDANSFTASNQTVTLDGGNASCADMDWSAVNRPVALRTAAGDATQRQLGIGGSLTLSNQLDVSNLTAVSLFLYGAEGNNTYTITTAGRALLPNVYVQAPGDTYTLQDALTLTPAVPTLLALNGRLYVEAGTLATNDQPVAAQALTVGYASTASIGTTGAAMNGPLSSTPAILNLGNSTVTLTPTARYSEAILYFNLFTLDFANTAVLNAGTSTINVVTSIGPNSFNNSLAQPTYVRAGLQTFNTVNFTDPGATVTRPVLTGAGGTFGRLSFAGRADIQVNNTYTRELVLAAGRDYNLGSGSAGTTQTCGSTGILRAEAACANSAGLVGGARIIGAASQPVTFTKPAGGTLNPDLQAVTLRNTTFAGGTAWRAVNSFDGGSNTGITLTAPVARTLYWVGGTGNWTDPAHWDLTSGGPGGACAPTQADDVRFDANSFTASNQTVTQNASEAQCASLSWAGVTNNPTFAGDVLSNLTVYGSLTWVPTGSMTLNLLGTVTLAGNGQLTSAGQLYQNSVIVNAPGATVTLADDLQQSPANDTNGLNLLQGTLATNNKYVRIRDFLSNGTGTRALNLGASTFEITYFAWRVSNSLALNAGTSTIFINTTTRYNSSSSIIQGRFYGAGLQYATLRTNPEGDHGIHDNSAFAALQLYGTVYVLGNNTVTQQLYLQPGGTFIFQAGSTTALAAAAAVSMAGTGSQNITLRSSTSGSQFTWTKPSGTVCASYIYIRDSKVTGGAYYEGGQLANNQSNNTGWSFAFVPQTTYAGRTTCPGEGPHTLRFTFSLLDPNTNGLVPVTAAQYPLQLTVRNLTTGSQETVTVSASPYDYLIPTSTATAQYQVVSLATNAASCGPITNTGPFPVVTDAVLNGPAGQWTGAGLAADGSWFDCRNWASGTIPTTATDVTIAASVPVLPALTSGGAEAHNLSIASGATFTATAAARLTLAGNWDNLGAASLPSGSVVAFAGTASQTVRNGAFGSVEVRNAAGLTLLSNASTSGTLTLTNGLVRTGGYQWQHLNASASSLGGYSATSYVAGNLRRALPAGSTAIYGFPVGTASQYALAEVLTNGLTGPTTLDAKFGAKPGTDAGLNYAEPGSGRRYTKIHGAGIWTLTPDVQPTGGNYAIRLALAPFSGLADNEFMLLKRPESSSNGADWSGDGGTVSADNGTGRRVADGYALRSGLSRFSQFGLAQVVAPLPVVLAGFTATAQPAAVLLDWRTATELNSAYFDVERSLDGITYAPIGRVAAAGTSALPHPYQLRDSHLPRPAPQLYYRLRQVDADGTTAYSPVRVVSLIPGALALYPNPATADTRLVGAAPRSSVQVLNALGQVVRITTTDEVGSAALPNAGLAAGVYVVRVGASVLRLVVE